MPNKLKQKITLIGSTGLIGSHFLEEISSDDYQIVNAITRLRISNLENKNFIKQSVHDFSDLGKRTGTRPAKYISKLIMNPFPFLIPWKYRPIHASSIAITIKYLIREHKSGKHIWEGRNLFEIQ